MAYPMMPYPMMSWDMMAIVDRQWGRTARGMWGKQCHKPMMTGRWFMFFVFYPHDPHALLGFAIEDLVFHHETMQILAGFPIDWSCFSLSFLHEGGASHSARYTIHY